MADAYLSTYNPDPNNATPAVQAALNYLKNTAPPRRLFVEPPPVPYSGYRLNNSGVVEDTASAGIKGLRVAVKVDFGDLEILGTDPANPPLFYTDDTFEFEANNPAKPGNATILFLFYAPSAGPAHSQFKLTHLKFRGPLLQQANQFPPGDASYGLVVFFGKAWNERLTHITVQYCTFIDPVRYAIDFEHVTQVTVSTCSFQMFDRYAYNELFPDTILPAIIVALFSAQNGIVNATVSGCVFNGRVKSETGVYNPAVNYNTRFGADGFVFFQKGGGINLTNNTIRRYYLEGIQTNAGPSYVTYNTFETPFSTGVAYMAYADTNHIMPGATPYILQRLYHFKHNTVNGGSVGVKFAGNNYPRLETANLAPQITGVVEDNTSIQLNPADKIVPGSVPTGVIAAGAESVTVRNNQFYNCSRMFHTGIEPSVQTAYVRTDFRCAKVLLESNTVHAFGPAPNGAGGSMESIFFQLPLRDVVETPDLVEATIGKNTLARRANFAHILLGGTNSPKFSKLTTSQGNHPPTPPVGQIEPGIIYKVYVPPMQSGSITYGGVTYLNGATFTGSPSFTYFQTTGAAQVRLNTMAPSSYVAKIGTSATNKNTYTIWDPNTQGPVVESSPNNQFIYYTPSTNSVIVAAATQPNSPKDGVSVHDY